MRKRVLHLLASNSFSGAENVAITIISGISKSTNTYDFCYLCPKGPITDVLILNDINYLEISKLTYFEVFKAIQMFKPQIIHAHDFRSSMLVTLIPSKAGIISHIHHNPPWIRKINLLTFLYTLLSFRFNKIVGVSDFINDEFIFSNYLKRKIEIISNPINSSKINRTISFSKVHDIVFIGRLEEVKDPLRFITLIELIKAYLPDVSVGIAGNGSLYSKCKIQIEKRELASNIHMYGFVDNPLDLMEQAKVTCITSKWEGYGLAAVESISVSTPVVATNVGGLRNIVNSSCGMLCNNNDEFVSEILQLLTNEKYFEAKKRGCIKRISELRNSDNSLKLFQEIYESL